MAEETQLLFDITILLVAAGLLSVVFGRLKMPTIIGYLAGGVLLGSISVQGMFANEATIQLFSELGIILLMFFIGIELNLKGLKRLGPAAFLIVSIEMSMMIIFGYYLGRAAGFDAQASIFLGAIMSGASTAAVLSVAKEALHMTPEIFRTLMSIMIFEDIAQVIILTIASPLATDSSNAAAITGWVILEIIAFIGLSIMIGLALMPRAMNWLKDRYSKETVLIVALAFCFVMALVSSFIGLSIAIGAFLAGIILSESSCNNILRRRIEPLKEVFMAIFFFAIGLQVDLGSIVANIWLCVAIAVVFIVGKGISVLVASYLTTMDLRSSFYISTSLVAMSEFGFIIATIALSAGVLDPAIYSTIIGAALITMVALPLLSRSGPRLFDRASGRAPSWAMGLVRRMERIRLEVRRKMAISPELRVEVRRQILMIFMDFVIIICVLIAFNLVAATGVWLAPVAVELHVVPSLLLFVITIAIIAPIVANIVRSLKLIALMITMSVSEGERHSAAGKVRIYRTFKDAGEVIAGIVLVLILVPFLPPLTGIDSTAALGLAFIMLVLTSLSWGVLRPALNRLSSMFVSRAPLDDEDDGTPKVVCED